MTTTTYRIQFTEILWNGNRRVEQDVLVKGDITAVQDRLDQTSWVFDSVTVTEFVGSDAAGRTVPMDDWLLQG